jgi:large subunit ribosomal protein L35
MPKMKTRKAAAKRFKRTGTGKYLHNRAGKRHLMSKKNAKRRRRLGQAGLTKHTERRRLRASLPYGLK